MIVLGIETSCDDTAVGIVSYREDGMRVINAHVLNAHVNEHAPWGGVVPEIAARSHLASLNACVKQSFIQAGIPKTALTAIAATTGPGLIGGVMVGSVMGKALAAGLDKPFVAINHLEAHALSVRLTHDVAFPFLLLLVSGGHCQLVRVAGVQSYTVLGATRDDSAGECFDKSARLLGLNWPGGPALEKAAQTGDPDRFALPRPLAHSKTNDFSFAGLKTAMRLLVESVRAPDESLDPQTCADLAASLQHAVVDVLANRTENVLRNEKASFTPPTALVAAGGVAANTLLRQRLADCAARLAIPLVVPPVAHCTDNGLMVAWAGIEKQRLGLTDNLDVKARPRWPLGEQSTVC